MKGKLRRLVTSGLNGHLGCCVEQAYLLLCTLTRSVLRQHGGSILRTMSCHDLLKDNKCRPLSHEVTVSQRRPSLCVSSNARVSTIVFAR